MARPKSGYRLSNGERIPGVTTIIGRFKESGGLLWWANRLAYEPLGQAYSLLEGVAEGNPNQDAISKFLAVPVANYDHTAVRDAAADAGTLAHQMVEFHLEGLIAESVLEGQPKDVSENAQNAFRAFLEWSDQTNLEVEHQELSLVSETHRFGGTLDACVLRVNGKRAIGDWKTSNGLYPDYLIQVAAYGKLYEECYPNDPVEGGYHILRFSKSTGDFHHHFFADLNEGWKAFLLMRQLYDIDKILKQRAK